MQKEKYKEKKYEASLNYKNAKALSKQSGEIKEKCKTVSQIIVIWAIKERWFKYNNDN